MKELPIGFFDSGLGGISVLNAVRLRMPGEDYLYYGDNANAPYGTRTPQEILALSRAAARELYDRGIKALVIACNTATGVAAEALSAALPVPVIGVQPALEAAQRLRRDGEILVMATPATFRTERYARLLDRFGEGVLSLPCPGLMEYVEREELEGAGLYAFLDSLLEPYRDRPMDAVVLGCTHYPFLQEAIAAFFPPGTPFIDASPDAARELRAALEERGWLKAWEGTGKVSFLSSAGPESLRRMERLLKPL